MNPCKSAKQAYVQFAHALKLESNNMAALKGRQAWIDSLSTSRF